MVADGAKRPCAVVAILFFRYRLANRCPYQLTTAPLGCVGDV